jgi:hypothetical protein
MRTSGDVQRSAEYYVVLPFSSLSTKTDTVRLGSTERKGSAYLCFRLEFPGETAPSSGLFPQKNKIFFHFSKHTRARMGKQLRRRCQHPSFGNKLLKYNNLRQAIVLKSA